MVTPISLDLRERIIVAYEEGDTQDEIADRFLVSQATVSRIIRLFESQGHVVPQKPGGKKPIINEEDYPFIKAIVNERPDMSLTEIAEKVSVGLGKPLLSQPTICRVLKKLNLKRKKKSRQASERDREDVKKKS